MRRRILLLASASALVGLLLYVRPGPQQPVPQAAPPARDQGEERAAPPAPGRPAPKQPAIGAPARAALLAGPARVEEGPPGGSIEGAVLSTAKGLGIEGAEVTFQKDDGAASVRTGRGGSFVFAPPAPGRYRVAAVAAEGFLPFAPAWGHSQLTVDLVAGQAVRGVAVRLQPAVEYTVAVRDARGVAVAGAEVRVLGAQSGELALLPLPEKTATGPAGEAKVRAPDGATVEARSEDKGSGRASVDFAAQASRRIAIRLRGAPSSQPRTLRIAGRATDEQGQAVASALVAVRDLTADGRLHPAGEALTDGDGRFSSPASRRASTRWRRGRRGTRLCKWSYQPGKTTWR